MKTQSRSLPSIFSVNLLFLVTTVLNIVIGSFLQTLSLTWGLITSEVSLILLPTLVFLRLRRMPLKEGLRLKPIRPLTGLLCLMLGFTTYLFVVVIDALVAQLSGIPIVPLSAEMMPRGTLEYVGFFFAVAVVAPLCEEPLFRGVIQGTYETQRTARNAITITALMFAFWHFQLSGLAGLLPAAFILGFVAWRTGSLYASILVHIGLNAPSVGNSLLTLSGRSSFPFLGIPAAILGLLATVALIYAIWRMHPLNEQPAPSEPGRAPSRWWSYSPLAIAGVLYLWSAAGALGSTQITLSQAGYDEVHIEQVLESRFRITNPAGEKVGDMICTITPQGSYLVLDCAGEVGAYEVTTSAGDFRDEEHSITWAATWDTSSMELVDYAFERTYQAAGSNIRATLEDGQLAVEYAAGTQAISVSPSDLVEYEWAWRVNALRPQIYRSIQAPLAYLLWSDEEMGEFHPALRDEILQLYGTESLDLPAGQVRAHKAHLGEQWAWYMSGHAGPVRIDDGTLIYELEE